MSQGGQGGTEPSSSDGELIELPVRRLRPDGVAVRANLLGSVVPQAPPPALLRASASSPRTVPFINTLGPAARLGSFSSAPRWDSNPSSPTMSQHGESSGAPDHEVLQNMDDPLDALLEGIDFDGDTPPTEEQINNFWDGMDELVFGEDPPRVNLAVHQYPTAVEALPFFTRDGFKIPPIEPFENFRDSNDSRVNPLAGMVSHHPIDLTRSSAVSTNPQIHFERNEDSEEDEVDHDQYKQLTDLQNSVRDSLEAAKNNDLQSSNNIRKSNVRFQDMAIFKIPAAKDARSEAVMFGTWNNPTRIEHEHERECTFCLFACDFGISDFKVWLPSEAFGGYCLDCKQSTKNSLFDQNFAGPFDYEYYGLELADQIALEQPLYHENEEAKVEADKFASDPDRLRCLAQFHGYPGMSGEVDKKRVPVERSPSESPLRRNGGFVSVAVRSNESPRVRSGSVSRNTDSSLSESVSMPPPPSHGVSRSRASFDGSRPGLSQFQSPAIPPHGNMDSTEQAGSVSSRAGSSQSQSGTMSPQGGSGSGVRAGSAVVRGRGRPRGRPPGSRSRRMPSEGSGGSRDRASLGAGRAGPSTSQPNATGVTNQVPHRLLLIVHNIPSSSDVFNNTRVTQSRANSRSESSGSSTFVPAGLGGSSSSTSVPTASGGSTSSKTVPPRVGRSRVFPRGDNSDNRPIVPSPLSQQISLVGSPEETTRRPSKRTRANTIPGLTTTMPPMLGGMNGLDRVYATIERKPRSRAIVGAPDRLADPNSVVASNASQQPMRAMGGSPNIEDTPSPFHVETGDFQSSFSTPQGNSSSDRPRSLSRRGSMQSIDAMQESPALGSMQHPIQIELGNTQSQSSTQPGNTSSSSSSSTAPSHVPGDVRISFIDGRNIARFFGIRTCRASPYGQIDVLKAKICAICRDEKWQIIDCSRHLEFTSTINDPVTNETLPRYRNCMICLDIAAYRCKNCPLRLCIDCEVKLRVQCKGYLNNLLYSLDTVHIRNDAFLLRSDGGGF